MRFLETHTNVATLIADIAHFIAAAFRSTRRATAAT